MLERNPASSRKRKNLVILRAGDNSLHKGWIANERDFDLLISYYGSKPDLHRDSADYYEMRKGPKWPCIGEVLAANQDLIEQYDAFWFPDDDLETTTGNINKMFAFFHAFELALAQPALTQDSYYSWNTLLQRHDYIVRFTRFVEVMAPIFDRGALKACLPSFQESRSGWGLDWLWPNLCAKGRQDRIGIIDATPVKHTRPLGGDLYKNNPEMSPKADEQAILDKYDLHQARAAGKYILYGGVNYCRPALRDAASLALRSINAKRKLHRKSKHKSR